MKAHKVPTEELIYDKRPYKDWKRRGVKVYEGDKGDVHENHALFSIKTQSLKEILRIFGDDIRELSINTSTSKSQTMNVDTLKQLGFDIKTRTNVTASLVYNKDDHASLKNAWMERLENKMDSYGIKDLAVSRLVVTLRGNELKKQIREIIDKHQEKWFSQKWKGLRREEEYIAIFKENLRSESLVREGINKHKRNKILRKDCKFKYATLDLKRLLTKRDYLTEHKKRRCYFVDWETDHFWQKRSPEKIVIGLKRDPRIVDKDGQRYGYINYFKLNEEENLVFAGGE